MTAIAVSAGQWAPVFEAWRHGGWYVTNVRYPTGAAGCVSRNYTDRKWRIVGRDTLGDPTYPSRDAAARAEREIALAECEARVRFLASKLYPAGPATNCTKPAPNHVGANCAACGVMVAERQGLEVFWTGMTAVVFLHEGCAEKVAAAQKERRRP